MAVQPDAGQEGEPKRVELRKANGPGRGGGRLPQHASSKQVFPPRIGNDRLLGGRGKFRHGVPVRRFDQRSAIRSRMLHGIPLQGGVHTRPAEQAQRPHLIFSHTKQIRFRQTQ